MKMIHCADLHLDSKMTANLSGDKRKERRAEILQSFRRMIQFATEHLVEVILIAGDLFDTNIVSAAARNTVREAVLHNPDICFYYLRGNHDTDGLWENGEDIPDNLKLFHESWNYYFQPCKKGQIVIAGAELNGENGTSLCETLTLHPEYFNIVLLHGQEMEYKGQDKTAVVPLRELRNKGIDYLALGHIHKYKKERLDARGIWCYPGCLEGRGFDECGEHGFVLLDIDEESGICDSQFIPFAERSLYTLYVNVSGSMSTEQIGRKVEEQLEIAGYDPGSLVKIVLTGHLDMNCEKNVGLLLKRFEHRYYYVKIYDETRLKVNYEKFAFDESLKGEFVRTVFAAEEIPEEEKAALIRYGIQALAGEDIE